MICLLSRDKDEGAIEPPGQVKCININNREQVELILADLTMILEALTVSLKRLQEALT
jgi:predicted nuclease of predicted toxin-antitoxin system